MLRIPFYDLKDFTFRNLTISKFSRVFNYAILLYTFLMAISFNVSIVKKVILHGMDI